VGISKLKSNEGKNVFKGIENGTKKTENKRTLSIDRNKAKSEIIATGIKLSRSVSLVAIK
jgi:hypothetical protein